jgi:hypothetical protein
MVDVEEIKQGLDNFAIIGEYSIDPHSGVVDVQGDVFSIKPFEKLPVRFGVVERSFRLERAGITSLEGCPHTVGDNFVCVGNHIQTLRGGPSYVGENYDCARNQLLDLHGAPKHVGRLFTCSDNPLKSLDGAPDSAKSGFVADYSPALPLLRLLQYHNFWLWNCPEDLLSILNKYKGTGKKGSLAAAVELARAGYKGNARW